MDALGVKSFSDVLNTQHVKGKEGNHSSIQSKFMEFSSHAGLSQGPLQCDPKLMLSICLFTWSVSQGHFNL